MVEYNRESTKDIGSLTSQLSRIDHRMASINFYTKEDLVKMQEEPRLLDKIGSWVKSVKDDIYDKFFSNHEYYQPITKPTAKLTEVLQ
ncbi:MAG: hypothetical protein LN588_00805 [Rickettsia endosymbiont of Bryobia graminum]|nr:hypothetical protein [Rickettsia endosymbiont of Bryobia graminum]